MYLTRFRRLTVITAAVPRQRRTVYRTRPRPAPDVSLAIHEPPVIHRSRQSRVPPPDVIRPTDEHYEVLRDLVGGGNRVHALLRSHRADPKNRFQLLADTMMLLTPDGQEIAYSHHPTAQRYLDREAGVLDLAGYGIDVDRANLDRKLKFDHAVSSWEPFIQQLRDEDLTQDELVTLLQHPQLLPHGNIGALQRALSEGALVHAQMKYGSNFQAPHVATPRERARDYLDALALAERTGADIDIGLPPGHTYSRIPGEPDEVYGGIHGAPVYDDDDTEMWVPRLVSGDYSHDQLKGEEIHEDVDVDFRDIGDIGTMLMEQGIDPVTKARRVVGRKPMGLFPAFVPRLEGQSVREGQYIDRPEEFNPFAMQVELDHATRFLAGRMENFDNEGEQEMVARLMEQVGGVYRRNGAFSKPFFLGSRRVKDREFHMDLDEDFENYDDSVNYDVYKDDYDY